MAGIFTKCKSLILNIMFWSSICLSILFVSAVIIILPKIFFLIRQVFEKIYWVITNSNPYENGIIKNKLNISEFSLQNYVVENEDLIKRDLSHEECSICLTNVVKSDNYKDKFQKDIIVETPCKHLFHFYCISQSFKFMQKCPNCRRII